MTTPVSTSLPHDSGRPACTLATEVPPRLSELLAELTTDPSRARPFEVALIGNYGNGNLGDEAILRGVAEAFGTGVQLTVMSRCPDRVRRLHGLRSTSMLSFAGVRSLWRADLVAIGGGGIFGNNMALLPRLLPFLGLLLTLLRRHVAFVAIGAYRTTPSVVKWALRLLARRAVLVTVRDDESAEVLAPPSVHVVADPGGTIQPAPREHVDRWWDAALPGDRPVLGVSMKPAAESVVDDRQIEVVEHAVRTWRTVHPQGRVLMLCLSDVGNFGLGEDRSDQTLAARVAARFPTVEFATAGPDVTPWLMKGLIGRCDAVVAHRLHAQLFAHDEGVPLFGLTWERKSDVFLDSACVPRVNLLDGMGDDVTRWLRDLEFGRDASLSDGVA